MGHTRTNKTEEKVFSFIREHQMLRQGDRVVAGISGGADSVCLLFVLCEWRKRYGLELAAVHVDHGIRPEAGEDARFVEELCARLKVPFFLREADIPALAADSGCTEEEAGRNYRYQVFAEVAESFYKGLEIAEAGSDGTAEGADILGSPMSAVKIAVAHNLNDLGETMLFHLFRGSGIKGLAGIAPVRDRVIRPLLCLERSEIEAYLAEKGQEYCTDATNEEDDHTRNRIRHHILPYAEREIVPGCVRHMGRTAEVLSEAEDYLEQQTRAALAECVTGDGNRIKATDMSEKNPADKADRILEAGKESEQCEYRIDCGKFSQFHPALQKRMLYELAKSLAPGAKDISYVHVADLRSLFTQEGNREICLPFGIRGRREYTKVILERGQSAEHKKLGACKRGDQENPGDIPQDPISGIQMVCEVLAIRDLPRNDENSVIFPQNQCTKWFDYDKIEESPVLRTRAEGDFLMITDGEGRLHRKSLKDYMVTEKIPRGERGRIPVLAAGSHVLWIVGYRISEYYKIDENTERVLQVKLM